jgi:hypothetical protein
MGLALLIAILIAYWLFFVGGSPHGEKEAIGYLVLWLLVIPLVYGVFRLVVWIIVGRSRLSLTAGSQQSKSGNNDAKKRKSPLNPMPPDLQPRGTGSPSPKISLTGCPA